MENNQYSFHTFMFPFQWKINDLNEDLFSEQIKLKNINYAPSNYWERVPIPKTDEEKEGMYNERNYFYQFVHNALYDDGSDDSFIRHFERKIPSSNLAIYKIDSKNGCYELEIASIILNLYSTGVGVLQFHLKNTKYKELNDIISINEYGRRIFPPFYDSINKRDVIAQSIELVGVPSSTLLKEDFNGYTVNDSNKPASFIVELIHEVASNISIEAVVDDRMFVATWYKNTEWVNTLCKQTNDKSEPWSDNKNWYRFIFIDSAASGDPSCQNEQMLQDLLKQATYKRWQNWDSLYGVSRYSLVYLTSDGCPDFLTYNFETEYIRIAEHILVQKASVLRFSAEVSRISTLPNDRLLTSKVDSLYKEYIRFVNQIHFREVSAQDQGIEMYNMMYETMRIEHQVEKLEDEIEDLYHYVSLLEDKRTNKTMYWLTLIATIFVPATVLTAIFGMNNTYNVVNNNNYFLNIFAIQIIAIIVSIVIFIIAFKIYNSKRWRTK